MTDKEENQPPLLEIPRQEISYEENKAEEIDLIQEYFHKKFDKNQSPKRNFPNDCNFLVTHVQILPKETEKRPK